tara:strand:+ start:327 stop:563 length:237 start_codon:yes stop_codon:yes gene_type:complete
VKTLQVGEVTEASELLMMAKNYQDQVDLISVKITRILGGVKDDFVHELVDQAVLNKESIDWIVEEIKNWEKYRQELKL